MLLTLVLPATFVASAQQLATPQMKQEANDFYQKQDWQNALKAYEKIVNLEETNNSARYRYGFILLNFNRNEEAKTQLEKVFASSPNPTFREAISTSLRTFGQQRGDL